MVRASLGRMTINHDSEMVSVPEALISFYRPSLWLAISTSRQWMVISLTVRWGHVNQPSVLLSEGIKMGLHKLHSGGLMVIPEKYCWSSVDVPRTHFFLRHQRYPQTNRGAEVSWLLHAPGGFRDATSSWMPTSQCLSSRWWQLSTSVVRRGIQQQVRLHRKGSCWGWDNTSFHQLTTVTPVSWMLFNNHLLTAGCGPRYSRKRTLGNGNDTLILVGAQKNTLHPKNSDKMWATRLGKNENEHIEKQIEKKKKKLVRAVEEIWINCILRI